jgi:peptidoglycan/LPS O-acetylase OafA/YrhL
VLSCRVFNGGSLLRNHRVFGLDLWRALAMLGVLFSHGIYVLPAIVRVTHPTLVELFSIWGFLGAESLFVLSGFLVGTITIHVGTRMREPATLWNFWTRRWLRTVPAYLFYLGLNLLLLRIMRDPPALPDLKSYVFFIQSLVWEHPPFFPEAWSLVVEIWFYILFPLALVLLLRRARSFSRAYFSCATLFVLVPLFLRIVKGLAVGGEWDSQFRKIALLRLDAIMFGVLAAGAKRYLNDTWNAFRVPLFLLGLGLVGLTYHCFDPALGFGFAGKTVYLSLVPLGFALLVPLLDQWRDAGHGRAVQCIRLFALWSYSIYLANMIVIHLIFAVAGYAGGFSTVGQFVSYSGYLVFTVLLSALTYNVIEKPAMDLRK